MANVVSRNAQLTRCRSSWSVYDDLSARDLVRVPGLLSLSRIPLAALFPFTLRRPAGAVAVLLVAGATDLLDGWYARRFHEQTRTGAALDGIADKVFMTSVVTSLLISGSLSWMEVALLGTREIGELALTVRLAADRERRRRARLRPASVRGKIATALQYAAALFVIAGSDRRRVFIAATALAGVLASASYWRRTIEATRLPPTTSDEPSRPNGERLRVDAHPR